MNSLSALGGYGSDSEPEVEDNSVDPDIVINEIKPADDITGGSDFFKKALIRATEAKVTQSVLVKPSKKGKKKKKRKQVMVFTSPIDISAVKDASNEAEEEKNDQQELNDSQKTGKTGIMALLPAPKYSLSGKPRSKKASKNQKTHSTEIKETVQSVVRRPLKKQKIHAEPKIQSQPPIKPRVSVKDLRAQARAEIEVEKETVAFEKEAKQAAMQQQQQTVVEEYVPEPPTTTVQSNVQPESEFDPSFAVPDRHFAKLLKSGGTQANNAQFIDIDGGQLASEGAPQFIQDTSHMPSAVKNKGAYSSKQKRKHQINYLLSDLRDKTAEIEERRTQGFKTKAETYGKYGW